MSLFGDMIKTDEKTEAVWKALADSTRRAMLDSLAEQPLMTGELVDQFDRICRTNVMKHLDVLVSDAHFGRIDEASIDSLDRVGNSCFLMV